MRVGDRVKAAKAADGLRKRWGAGARPASQLFSLAERQNVLVFRLAMATELSGAFIRSARHRVTIIVVNTTDKNVVHQRFTLAHELGHSELHADQKVVVDRVGENSRDPRETEANAFAAQLLVPERELKETLRAYHVPADKVTDPLVVELAQMFGVSHEVILWRLKDTAGLSQETTKRRIEKTDWSRIRREYAPQAYRDMWDYDSEPDAWTGKGVSPMTERQIRRLPVIYREHAFEAYRRRLITAGKLAELLSLESKQVVLDELLPLIDPEQHASLQSLGQAIRRGSSGGR